MKTKRLVVSALACLFLALFMSLTSSVNVLADAVSDYEICDCWWEYDKQTETIIAEWDKTEESTKKILSVYRGSKAIISDKKVTGTKYDLTDVVSKNGSGDWKFTVYPEKLGSGYTISSEVFEISADMVKAIKKEIAAEKAAVEATKIGWVQEGPNGSWKYYKSAGVMAKNEWLTINGQTYHFSKDGLMQTGWQAITDRWYYFDASGALLRNTVTPDGYKVNANGAWVDAAGNEISVSAQKKNSSTTKSKTTKTTKTKLDTPTNFYIDGSGILKWDKVEGAYDYRIEIYGDGSRITTVTPKTNYLDVSEYLDNDEIIMLKISAKPKSSSSEYSSSGVATIDDLDDFAARYSVEGTLKKTSSGLKYLDEDGNKMKGWQMVLGYWYHFDKTGMADGPGWWQDSDGNWYYFDSEYRMCTGWINDGKADYFMNDGSVANLPVGAWKK